jgi:adenylate cyclase
MSHTDRPTIDLGFANQILGQGLVAAEGDDLLGVLGRALNAAGLPIMRLSIGMPTLHPSLASISLSWRRDGEVQVVEVSRGDGEAEFLRSPIHALVAAEQQTGRWRVGDGEGCNEFPLLADMRREGASDYLLRIVAFAPDIAILGAAVSFATDRPGGFTEADLATVEALLPSVALVSYRFCLSATLKEVLGAYVGPRTASRILAGKIRRGEGEVISAAILVADLRAFTLLADHEDPLQVVGWLDQHLEALGEPVEQAGGEILKFTGDGFMAVFPVEDPLARPCGVCDRALAAARAGLARNRALALARSAAGEPALAADLALHYGDVVYGNVGITDRLDFTAIGRAVNEASRMEKLCDEIGRNLLLSDSFAQRCAGPLVELGAFPLRGVGGPQRLWTVADPADAPA